MNDIRPGYLRISEILGRLRDRTGIHEAVLRDKCNIGTEVHHNIHLDVMQLPVGFKMFPVRHAIDGNVMLNTLGHERYEKRGKGYFESWKLWDEKTKPGYELMEKRYYCDELLITGQIDATITEPVKDGKRLLDFKCSYSADEEIWEMQAHFYYYLLKQNGVEVEPEMTFMQLKKDGKKPKLYHFKFDENVLSRCICEAQLTWEEKKNAKSVD